MFIFGYCLAYFHLITMFWLDSLLNTEKVNRKHNFLYVMRTNLTIIILSVCLSVRLDNSVNIVRSELEVLRKRSTFKERVCSANILGTVSNATWNLWMSGRQRRPWSDAASGSTLFVQTNIHGENGTLCIITLDLLQRLMWCYAWETF